MSAIHRILILARRVLQQLLADRRTLALVLVVPIVVLTVAGILLRLEPEAVGIAVVLDDVGTDLPVGSGSINLGERLTTNLSGLNDKLDIQVMSAAEAHDKMDDG
ncbi:MAG: hypothetical protein JXJ20_07605, partial [Anaerolineae bacterium]|nr:hypothetical protein [Anaerolineae bacterium]